MKLMQLKLPIEIIEHILALAFLTDLATTTPNAYTRVAPGLSILHKLVYQRSYKLETRRKLLFMTFDQALKMCDLELMKRYVKYCRLADLEYSDVNLIPACAGGRLDVLQWLFTESKLPVHYDGRALNAAIVHRQFGVLNFWKHSGLKITLTNEALSVVVKCDMFDCLNWFIGAGLRGDLGPVARLATERMNVRVLRWCEANDIATFDFTETLGNACRNGQTRVLDVWLRDWREKLVTLDWTACMIGAARDNMLKVSGWLTKVVPVSDPAWIARKDGAPLHLIDVASKHNALGSLDWIMRELPPAAREYTEASLDANVSFHLEDEVLAKLNWWFESGLPLKYTAAVMDAATANAWDRVLAWWRDSGLELKYSGAGIADAVQRRYAPVVEFWRDSGLPRWARPEDFARMCDEEFGEVCFVAAQSLRYELSEE
ncbi:hypothetical protein H9P43_002578 [Blastocladiella emersonii ATCC 22665]|nr:hypothetical protein H9P43_002578 [Blastocladiella emersonii ATCC 22665]